MHAEERKENEKAAQSTKKALKGYIRGEAPRKQTKFGYLINYIKLTLKINFAKVP